MHIPDPVVSLRGASLRITKQRVAVLEVLHRIPHADVEHIHHAVRDDLGSVSTQAVYDVLAALLGAGLVRRIGASGSPARFELRTEVHDHLACRACGALADVERGGTPVHPRAEQARGYRIDEAEVTYWGLCPSCQPGTAITTPIRTNPMTKERQ
jgi:Fur family transcriptional regulator, stress-responsive regulator